MAQQKIEDIRDDFASAFEVEFARLRVRLETACVEEKAWPARVAAGIRACCVFAAEHPEEARLLTSEALARDEESRLLYEQMISYFAAMLRPGRDLNSRSGELPAITESAMAGGVAMLIGRRLDQGQEAELPALAADAIVFVLTPYVGIESARRFAASAMPRPAGRDA